MINFNDAVLASLPKSQQQAIRSIIKQVIGEPHHNSAAGHEIVHTVEADVTDYGAVWVKIESDIPSLGAGNALRFYTSLDGWFIHFGPRGAAKAHRFPNWAKGMKKLGRLHFA